MADATGPSAITWPPAGLGPDGLPRDPIIRTAPAPADVNGNGDIFGGWVLSQMDIAGGIAAGSGGASLGGSAGTGAFGAAAPAGGEAGVASETGGAGEGIVGRAREMPVGLAAGPRDE